MVDAFKSLRIIMVAMLFISVLPAVSIMGFDNDPVVDIDNHFEEKQESGVEYKKMKIYNYAGVEMIQLRELADELDWTLVYESENREVRIRKGALSYSFSSTDPISEEARSLLIKEGRTYLAMEGVRELLQQLGEELLITGLYTEQSLYKKGEQIRAHLRVYNFTSESIRLNFGSGQRYDLYLQQNNEEIWRWSDGRFFTMALIYKEIEPGENLAYDVEVEMLPIAGEYVLGGELATIPERIKLEEVSVKVED